MIIPPARSSLLISYIFIYTVILLVQIFHPLLHFLHIPQFTSFLLIPPPLSPPSFFSPPPFLLISIPEFLFALRLHTLSVSVFLCLLYLFLLPPFLYILFLFLVYFYTSLTLAPFVSLLFFVILPLSFLLSSPVILQFFPPFIIAYR